MDRPVMFNGRLSKEKVGDYLEILAKTSNSIYIDYVLAEAFLKLPESITFVSSIDDAIIGGASIYRDRTRLGMVLASVAVLKQFRNSASYQIVKSSLPFFKTVAIRDVDALVSLETEMNTLGFPLSLELDSWILDILKRIGFSEMGKLEHYTFEINEGIKRQSIKWLKEAKKEIVSELIWDQSKAMGLTNSVVWLARDLAASKNCLMISVEKEKPAAVAGFWKLSDRLCVTPLLIDSDIISWNLIADSLIAEARLRNVKFIELPLFGVGQLELARELESYCAISSVRKLSLLRKSL